jgi:hypothetical protein
VLKKLKLDTTILSDIDKELEVPKAWMDGARREAKLRIFSTGSRTSRQSLSPI